MAEAAGLVIGVVALIGTFKDCIDLYSYISTARSLGRDRELLETKLDVERTLLLQWADRVGLVKQEYDKRLDDPALTQAILRVLANIQRLLSESRELEFQYGGNASIAANDDEDQQQLVCDALSEHRMVQFIRQLDALPNRIRHQIRFSNRQKIRWVLRDKDKFEALVAELSYFNSKLNRLIPETSAATNTTHLIIEDISMIEDFKKLRLLPKALAGHGDTLVATVSQVVSGAAEWRLLERLRPYSLDLRRDNVADAHSQTFRWVLETHCVAGFKHSLHEWLKTGTGSYWLSGKAGSGKSTLMKFIRDHPRTTELLKEWAGPKNLISPWFYLWNLGTQDQKSQTGLLRALLYQILDVQPSLIGKTLPRMYHDARNMDFSQFQTEDLLLPSHAELVSAFESLAAAADLDCRICFFVDGLDEFSGRYSDAIHFIKGLSKNPDFKVLVSSRPIPACVEAFSKGPMLKLQDHTRHDIQQYVMDTVGSHPYLTGVLDLCEEDAAAITGNLLSKASGVFLWVVLACRSILDGFEAYDSLSDLEKRIDELPLELEDLFKHMLGRVEPRYQAHGARLLKICHQNQLYSNLSSGGTLYTLGLALVDEQNMSAERMPAFRNLTKAQKMARCRILEGRLRSRCCGLLELCYVKSCTLKDCSCVSDEESDNLVRSDVNFMHRTVFEFLSIPETWQLDCLRTNDSFEPSAILSNIFLQLAVAGLICPADLRYSVQGCLRHLFIHSALADAAGDESILSVMLKLEVLLQDYSWMPEDMPLLTRIQTYRLKAAKPNLMVLLAVESGLINVLEAYQAMKGLDSLPWGGGLPLLYHAACQPLLPRTTHAAQEAGYQRHKMVQFLISRGCNPNEQFLDGEGEPTSPWKAWLRISANYPATLSSAAVMEAFIRAGSDLNPKGAGVEPLEKYIKKHYIDFGLNDPDLLAERRTMMRKGLHLMDLVKGMRS